MFPHHVTERGNRWRQTFFTADDYEAYFEYIAQSAAQSGAEDWAYCLMPNHVYFILVPSEEDGLRATFAESHRLYKRRINFRNGWRGHLWQERFHSIPHDEQHLHQAVRYVELNPAAAVLKRRWRMRVIVVGSTIVSIWLYKEYCLFLLYSALKTCFWYYITVV